MIRAASSCFIENLFPYGFAARCAAMALPRRERAVFHFGLCPGSGWALSTPKQITVNTAEQMEVKDRTKGTARNETRLFRRGRAIAAHRTAKPNRVRRCRA
jgi:hypothetical protein